ncbi:MAG: hypothetical protein KGS60_10590 [Verrucomicrobia bacterium]|nr:hypothetical protein [Verrucomicrobiota bacterium]
MTKIRRFTLLWVCRRSHSPKLRKVLDPDRHLSLNCREPGDLPTRADHMKNKGFPISGLALLLMLWAAFSGERLGAAEEWTDRDGRVIRAEFIRLEGEVVVIEKEGKRFSVPLSRLSDRSSGLARELGGRGAGSRGWLSPGRFLGKSFAECEDMLGPPDRGDDGEGEGRTVSRYFHAPAPGILRLRLEAERQGDLPPRSVTSVWYYFSKGRVRTVGQCFQLTGTEFAGGYRLFNMFKEISGDDALSETQYVRIEGIPGRMIAGWEPAAFGKDRPPEYRHENEDAISFQKQRGLNTWQRYLRMREQSAAP